MPSVALRKNYSYKALAKCQFKTPLGLVTISSTANILIEKKSILLSTLARVDK
jgi:hypothetical protein